MEGKAHWLPPLITLEDYGGDWDRYEAAIYTAFRVDWVVSRPSVNGKRMGLKAHPLRYGREATYYHLTNQGEDETTRRRDLRRMERIRWPRAMIEVIGTDRLLMWTKQVTTRGGLKQRIVLALPDFSYIVVLEDRGGYALLWTAYPVERSHRREKLWKEYTAHK